MSSKKRGFHKKGFCLLIFLYLSIILFSFNCYGKDKINLDLLGKWEGGYSFYCAEIIQYMTDEGSPVYAFCGTNKGLLILNITDPKNPDTIGSLDIGNVYDITLFKSNSNSFNYAALANGTNGLVIVDISDITNPFYAGGFDTQGISYNVVVSENYAYMSDWDKGLIIIDISNPTKPIYTGGYDTQGWASDVVISGNYAYVSDSKKGLAVIDISNPQIPVYTGGCETEGDAQGVAIFGDYAFVADGENGLLIIEITDPAKPAYKGKYDTQGNVRSVTISGNFAHIADSQKGFVIVDISDPINPVYAGRYRTEGSPETVSVFGSYACVTDWEKGLFIIDISKLKIPAYVGQYDTFYACGLAINEDYVYMADGEDGLVIINVSDPNAPSYTGGYNTQGYACGVAVSGSYAFLADGENGLVIVDITNPGSPSYKGGYNTQGEALGVVVSGSHAFVADGDNGLVIVDITNPGSPFRTGRYNTQGEARGLAVSGSYAYVADGDNGLVVINITNPTSPSYEGKYDFFQGNAEDVSILNNYAYVAYSENGLVVIDISEPDDPSYIGWYNTQGYARGIAVFKDYAYIADGENGLVVVDIANPDPRGYAFSGGYNTQGDAGDVAISGNYAYIADGENGLVIIDIIDTTDNALSGKVDTYGLAMSVAVSGDYAYVAYEESGLVVLDISDPDIPVFAGRCDTDDAYRVTLSGNYAYVADWEKGLLIIDVSNPEDPGYTGGYKMKGYAYAVAVSGNYAFVASGSAGLTVIDISDPNAPFYAGKYDADGYAYNIAISDNHKYAYVADWDNGLEILDITTPAAPSLIGRFEIQDEAQAVAISGNYAFVAYGDIDIGTGRPGGLIAIDISVPTAPSYAGEYQTPFAYDVSVSGTYIYIADAIIGIVALDISNPAFPVYAGSFDKEISFSVSASGSYAYVTHGPYGTKGFTILKIIDAPLPQGNITICATGPASVDNPLWPPSEKLANLAFATFLNKNYTHSFIYYFNPKPHQDMDGDGILDPFMVDDTDPTIADMKYSITSWAYNRLNTGPFYLYFTGQGARDVYQIFPGQILKASDFNDPNNSLKHYLDYFQEDTNRDIICLFEFSSSGSFCDDLIGPDTTPYSLTIITCTDDGPSFLDQEGQNSFTVKLLNLLQGPGQTGLFEDTGISYYQRVRLLQGLFSQARETFLSQGYPFNIQPPQMVTSQGHNTLCSITLLTDSSASPVSDPNQFLITNPGQTVIITPTGHYPDGDMNLSSNQVYYHSSDESILLITQEGEAYANPDTNYNGTAYVLATIIDPNFTQSPGHDPDIPPLGGVTGKVSIQVNIPGRKEKEDLPKAIIVAGRCNDPSGYDYLWESTNRMANHAYHTFISRGYSPSNICYLSHDPNQKGVDGPEADETFHGILEKIFTDFNNPYLDLDGLTDLTIFFIDHGKFNKFILGPTDEDYLSPTLLNFWLDSIQKKYPAAKITVIIEACYSGCFVDTLTQGAQNRVVITSTQETTAYLAANGWVSFTYFLFNYLKSGASLADAFEAAYLDIAALSWGGIQHPILQDNQDLKLASKTLLGGSFILSQDQPYIIQVSKFDDPNNPVLPHTPIDLWAEVTDLDGVERVWAIISASQSSLHFSGSMDDPIVGLPTIDLSYNPVKNRYEGTYQGFTYTGPYAILFLAQDTKGMVSYPKTVHLNVEGYNQDRAFLVYDPGLEVYADFAQWVLTERRFPINNIQKLEIDELSSALSSIDTNHILDHLLLYFILEDTSGLDPNDLDTQLDRIQQDTNCTVIILADSPYSGRLLTPIGGENEKNRIIITSTDANHPTSNIGQPFSQFFFSGIYNGIDINQAYHSARFALGFFSGQNPLLDDNGNGQAPDYGLDYDGKFAAGIYLGSPFELVTAGPRITVPSAVHINGLETSTATIWAQVRDPNSSLWALISPSDEEGVFDTVALAYNPDNERFEAEYDKFIKPGVYAVVVYVQEPEGLLDYDKSSFIVLEPDGYEEDDTIIMARPILVNHTHQTHSFHNPNDTDFVYFYGYENLPYQVKAEREWTDCQVLMEVFDSNMIPIGYPSPYAVGFSVPHNGFYYVRISYPCQILPSFYPSYDLSVTCPSAGNGLSGIYGWVRDSQTGKGIIKAELCFTNEIQQCGESMDEWWTNEANHKIGLLEKGFFFINNLNEGTGSLYIQASGYISDEFQITVSPLNMVKTVCYLDRDQNIPVYEPAFDPDKMRGYIGLIEDPNTDIKLKLLEIPLHKGLNLFSYPLHYPVSYYAGQFLNTHDPEGTSTGPEWFSGIRYYNSGTRSEETCYFVFSDQNNWTIKSSDSNNPAGFLIRSGEGYAIYMQEGKALSFPFPPPNQPISLKKGINWVGVPSPPPGYTSYIMLRDIGTPDEILGISGYNPITGQREDTCWKFGKPCGKNFPILSGQGFLVFMKTEKTWLPEFGP